MSSASADSSPTYQRFPGRGRRPGVAGLFGGTHQLWFGADHLLSVESSGYTESYRRYYHNDIQSIVVERTSRVIGLLVLTLLIAVLTAAFHFGIGEGGLIVALIVLWPLLLILSIHAGRGPTCKTWIQTAVSRELLPSLSRVRRAQRALKLMVPRITATQGSIGIDELRSAPLRPTRAPAAAAPRAPGTSAARGPYRGHYHLWLFALLLVDAVITVSQIEWRGGLAQGVGLLVMLAVLGCLIPAAASQSRSNLPSAIRGLCWGTLVYLFVAIYAVVFSGVWLGLEAGMSGKGFPELVSAFEEGQLRTVFLAVSALISAVIGLSGLRLVLVYRRTLDVAAASTPETPPT